MRHGIITIFITAILTLGATFVQAGQGLPLVPETIRMVKGQSVIIDAPERVTRVSLASPDMADLHVISPTQAYVSAKQFGSTTLTMWAGQRVIRLCELVITPDVNALKRMLRKVLPHEPGIGVVSDGQSITLTGTVHSPVSVNAALSVAAGFSSDNKVTNLLRVDGVQQVMLEVKIAEMTRTALQRMGFNFAYLSNGGAIYSFLNGLTKLDGDKILMTDRINGAFSMGKGSNKLHGFIDALKANGLVRILAEPNMVCVSGETADFLAGGEIPIPIPQSFAMVTIDYKPFGVSLQFKPTVLSSGVINLKVSPEVSELDYSNAVNLSGYTIPTLTTRKASTVVELGDGQSFAVAGLISNSLRENANRFPVLGDVPVLGTMFRSNDFSKSVTELVIIVTVHLVKPIDAQAHTLPTDNFKEPSDYEFFMLGLLEGKNKGPQNISGTSMPHAAGPVRGFDGNLGHAAP